MALKGCGFILALLLLVVLAYSLFSSNLDANIPIPTFSLPTLGSIGTLPPIISSPVAGTPGGPLATAPPLKTIPAVTPTPGPPQNGRILFLGFDQAIWSTNPDGTGPLQLGFLADFQLSHSHKWYSPDGRYILASRQENSQPFVYLTAVDGAQAIRIAPLLAQFDFGAPRDVFEFSSDGQYFFFVDAETNPASLVISNLSSSQTFIWPIQASAEELTYAAFARGESSTRLVLKSFDPAVNGHYLEMYDITNTLTNPRRIADLHDHRIEQFSISPNGRFAAVVYRSTQDTTASDELYAVDLQTNRQAPLGPSLVDKPGARIMLIAPSWSGSSRFLLANIWAPTPDGKFSYTLASYDFVTGAFANLIGPLNSAAVGLPLARVLSFSPDGAVAGVHLYGADNPKNIYFYRLQLDGSQSIKIASAEENNKFYQGQFVPSIAPDWTKMLLITSPDNPAASFPNTGELFSAWLDGNGRVSLDSPVPLMFYELGPILSPDSKQVAYLRINLSAQQTEFVTSDVDGSSKKVLFTGAALSSSQAPAGLPLVWLPKSR